MPDRDAPGYGEILSFDPIDPLSVTEDELRERAGFVLGHQAPDDPVPPGLTRCLICRRPAEMRPYEELVARHRARFGHDLPPERQAFLCTDCGGVISRALGLPPPPA